jgi:spore coat polysaccharide biosynthesis protein SpsF (cytidylyltransferase family)
VNESAAIVIQARMGSKRLPGKVLEQLAGRSLFAHCVGRLRARSGLPVILATTTLREDDALVAAADRLGVSVVRGPEDDVLARYVLAAATFALVEVIRATSDNPAVDMDSPLRTLELLRRTRADYVVERGMPVGGAVEAVSAAALFLANASTDNAYDREHVTPFIRRERQFVSLDSVAPGHLRRPGLRLTVDTPDDLAFMRRALAQVAMSDGSPAPLSRIILAAELLRYSDYTLAAAQGLAR